MSEDEYRQLIETSYQLHQLTEHPGWNVLERYLEREVISPAREALLTGTLSYENYRAKAGFIDGAGRALKAYKEVGAQVERERKRRQEAE